MKWWPFDLLLRTNLAGWGRWKQWDKICSFHREGILAPQRLTGRRRPLFSLGLCTRPDKERRMCENGRGERKGGRGERKGGRESEVWEGCWRSAKQYWEQTEEEMISKRTWANLKMCFFLSTILRAPFEPQMPMSPVCSQPSESIASAVLTGSFRYPKKKWWRYQFQSRESHVFLYSLSISVRRSVCFNNFSHMRWCWITL